MFLKFFITNSFILFLNKIGIDLPRIFNVPNPIINKIELITNVYV